MAKKSPVPSLPQPTASQLEQIDDATDRISRLQPRVKVDLEGGSLAPPHSDAVGHLLTLMDAIGSRSRDFLSVNLGALEAATRERGAPRSVESAGLNAGIALVQAIEPENELESALAVQMAGTHALATDLLCMAKQAQSTEHLALYANLAVKFERTFTMQIEALGRMRRGGEQVVKHVHVNEGGQAVIAGTVHTGGARNEITERPHEQAADAAIAALPGPDPTRDGVPVPGNAQRPLQAARRAEHRASVRKSKRA